MEDVFRLGSTHIPDRTAITCLQEKQAGTVQVVDGSEVLLCMPEPKLRCVDDLQSASRCRRNACCLAGLDLASLPGSGRADRAVARRQGTNVFPTAKKARPHFEKPGEVSLGGATLLRIVPTVGKGELPPAHLRRAFAANSKYDKIVMPSSHTLGVAYVRLSEVAISFHDRTM